MRTAMELFAYEGYYTTSISKIATKAGISKGLMYNYFSGKEELVKAIIQSGVETILDTFDRNKDGILTDEEMVYFLDENFRIIRENIPYWKLYYALLMQPMVYKLVADQYKDLIPRLLGIITAYFERKGAEQPQMEALFFGALMDGISFNFVMDPENFPMEAMKKFIIQKINQQHSNTPEK